MAFYNFFLKARLNNSRLLPATMERPISMMNKFCNLKLGVERRLCVFTSYMVIWAMLSDEANCVNFRLKEQMNGQSELTSKILKSQYLHGFPRSSMASHMSHTEDTHFLTSQEQATQLSTVQSTQVSSYKPRIFYATMNGADPTGGTDSTTELQSTINEAFEVASTHSLMTGIIDFGGVEVHLGGGQYVISKPLTIPDYGGGNVVIRGGTLRASSSFPADGFLLELATSKLRDEWERLGGKLTESHAEAAYENIVLQNLMLDANYIAGGILLLNPLRTTISNCYIVRFASIGISIQGGHETLIHSSFLGQHITSGGDPLESTFSGTAILLSGNDNSVTDVVIFSAQTAIIVDGQANIITGVHCYNKASSWGGTGILVKQGAIQTRILGCYLDYTGIVLEETRQITITNSFFLGDAYVLLRALGTPTPSVFGVSIVDNMFHGSNRGIPIVQLQGDFSRVKQSHVDRNSATGMAFRSTRARASTTGFGVEWTIDLSQILLFPNSIAQVHYSFYASTNIIQNVTSNAITNSFPSHALKVITPTSITVASNIPVHATVAVSVDQSFYDEDVNYNHQAYL